ncbi:transposase [Singulisphaera sp. GP187]|uniref:IS66 family transposase n=1 Tax=Singulisphaera sp. GP187 TaxID=1882752 RepID=UPI000928A998|nr:IS66 family transposase [Singulisphaera sp. GP187]SIO63175.1 transposase [Singulisphaera sp. GP187]
MRGENRTLQDRLFGRRSEKASSQDRSNHLDGEDDPPRSTPPKRGQRIDRPGPIRRDYSHLPVVEDVRELPLEQRVCPRCGAALSPSDTEDSEQIEIEVRAYRRRIRRRRYQRTCNCADCARTVTAPPAPKLIPKGLLGVSVWVEILLDKFVGHRPTERLLHQWRLLGLDVAAGTVAGGLERLEPLFQPLYQALLTRNAKSVVAQADETRWMVFIVLEGKTGYRWWLWVFLGTDTVVFRLDPSRSHEVPEGHFPADSQVVLMVDRYSAYKAMAQVKLGQVTLAFCWAHVRRDFVAVGKGWPEHKEWALGWLHRIRELYRHDRSRRNSPADDPAFTVADRELRRTVAAMQTQTDAELSDPKLPTPCRKVLTSLQEHWEGLTRFLDDPRIPLDNNASERQVRGAALGRKNYYGSGAMWSGRLAAMLFSLSATLKMAEINIRTWLTWYLESCAENGGQVPADIDPFLPWKMSEEKRRELAIDPNDSS